MSGTGKLLSPRALLLDMLNLTDEERMVLEAVKDLAESEFSDTAFTWDGDDTWENIELLGEQGFLGISLPEDYGGGGLSETMSILMIEVVGQICPDTAYLLHGQQMVAPRAIEMFGSEEIKEEYLPPVVDGEERISIAISEPEAGSDVQSMTTTCTDRGDSVVVDGEKLWVSHLSHASSIVVWARFPEGLGTVIVDLDDGGVEMGESFTNMAGHEQRQIFLNEVELPADRVLVRGSNALKEQLKALNWERAGNAMLANSIAKCGLDRALAYAGERVQFGQPIGEFQGIEWKLADMVKQVEAARSLIYTATTAAEEENRPPDRLRTSIAKLYSVETAERVVSESLQIHGANGYQQGHPLEYLYRLVRGFRIAAGTDEMQKNTIASALKESGVPQLI